MPCRRAVSQYERALQLENIEHLKEPRLGGRLASFESRPRSGQFDGGVRGRNQLVKCKGDEGDESEHDVTEWEMASRGANPPHKS